MGNWIYTKGKLWDQELRRKYDSSHSDPKQTGVSDIKGSWQGYLWTEIRNKTKIGNTHYTCHKFNIIWKYNPQRTKRSLTFERNNIFTKFAIALCKNMKYTNGQGENIQSYNYKYNLISPMNVYAQLNLWKHYTNSSLFWQPNTYIAWLRLWDCSQFNSPEHIWHVTCSSMISMILAKEFSLALLSKHI